MHKVDSSLKKEVGKFGTGKWQDCFHCGTCTAACQLSDSRHLIPRSTIRSLQLGLTSKVHQDLDPWLCYYCGDCSETCMRDANPGELMMTLRRYLTSVYDWTGISRIFYTKRHIELWVILGVFTLVVALFAIFLPPSAQLFSNPEAFLTVQGGVAINSLVDGIGSHAFVGIIETFDIAMALFIGLLLISNIIHMWTRTVLSRTEYVVPVQNYFLELWQLIFHFSVQPKFSKCSDKKYWGGHFLMMSGYTVMFIMIVALLPKFQTEVIHPWYHWQRLLGYYATFGILFFLSIVAVKRLRRTDIKLKFSHISDWLFIILLLLTTLSGIFLHFLRISGMLAATYFMYVFHLAVLVPMLIVEVPFSKWSHLAYRPFAVYFARLNDSAIRRITHSPAYV